MDLIRISQTFSFYRANSVKLAAANFNIQESRHSGVLPL